MMQAPSLQPDGQHPFLPIQPILEPIAEPIVEPIAEPEPTPDDPGYEDWLEALIL